MLHRLLSPLPALGLSCCLVALAAAVPISAQAWTISLGGSGARVTGSGQMQEQQRSVGAFSRLRLDGAITVEASPGAAPRVSVRADDNLLSLITTEVQGDTLVVSTRSGASFSSRQPIVVSVNFTQLVAAELRGSGDLNISQLQGERFDAALAGSGDVRLSQVNLGQLNASVAGSGDLRAQGQATEVSVSVAGSGDVFAAELTAKRGRARVAGSGDARVHASESMEVSVAGSGDVWVSGNPPQLKQSVAGSGDVHRVR